MIDGKGQQVLSLICSPSLHRLVSSVCPRERRPTTRWCYRLENRDKVLGVYPFRDVSSLIKLFNTVDMTAEPRTYYSEEEEDDT